MTTEEMKATINESIHAYENDQMCYRDLCDKLASTGRPDLMIGLLLDKFVHKDR